MTKKAAGADPAEETPPGAARLIDIEALLQAAIEKGVTAEGLKELTSLASNMQAEAARLQYVAALTKFQNEVPTIQKTEAVGAQGSRGPKYRFAPLDHIVATVKAKLFECGLSYSFKSDYDTEGKFLTVICCIQHLAGHVECSPFTVPVASDTFMNGAQHAGSASTYAKRYAFVSALGLVTGDEDDDAIASGQPRQTPAGDNRALNRAANVGEPGAAEQSATLDKQIMAVAEGMGYDRMKVDKWIRKKYTVIHGLADLSIPEKTEALKLLTENAGKAAAGGAAGGTSASNPQAGATGSSAGASPTPTGTPTADADQRVVLEPASDPKDALTKTMVSTLSQEMTKAGLDADDFGARFGFALAAAKKADYKVIAAWIKDPHEK
jgi:hypothetical protein